MKLVIGFALLTAFTQYAIVPSFDTSSVASAVNARAAMIEEASK
jgi:hypothetical protein